MKKKETNKKKVITTTAFVVGGICLAISAGTILNRSEIGEELKSYIVKRMMSSIIRHNDMLSIIEIAYNENIYLSFGYTKEEIAKVSEETLEYFSTHLPIPKVG